MLIGYTFFVKNFIFSFKTLKKNYFFLRLKKKKIQLELSFSSEFLESSVTIPKRVIPLIRRFFGHGSFFLIIFTIRSLILESDSEMFISRSLISKSDVLVVEICMSWMCMTNFIVIFFLTQYYYKNHDSNDRFTCILGLPYFEVCTLQLTLGSFFWRQVKKTPFREKKHNFLVMVKLTDQMSTVSRCKFIHLEILDLLSNIFWQKVRPMRKKWDIGGRQAPSRHSRSEDGTF